MASAPELFFFNDTATTEIYTLSLHDALPILAIPARVYITVSRSGQMRRPHNSKSSAVFTTTVSSPGRSTSCRPAARSEEHTSELQSRQYLVSRLLLDKKRSGARRS